MVQSTNGGPAPAGVSGWLRRHAMALTVSLVVTGGLIWLLKAGALPVVPPREAWSSLRVWTVVAYVPGFLFVHVLRCSRWSLLVEERYRLPLGRTLAIAFIGYGAQLLLPFRLGEAVRPALIRSHTRLPLATAAGVSAAERIVDGLLLSSLLVVSLLSSERVSPLPDHIGALPIPAVVIPALAWGGTVAFGLLSLIMVVSYVYQGPVSRWLERYLGRWSPELARWAARTMNNVVGGFAFLRELDTRVSFALLTLVYWIANLVTFWLLLWGAGVENATLLEAGVVLGVLGLGMAVPNAPGYFGTFQISGYAALVLFYPLDVVTHGGAAFLFLLYVIQLGLTLLVAGLALFWGLPPRSSSGVGTASRLEQGTAQGAEGRAKGGVEGRVEGGTERGAAGAASHTG